MGKTSQQEVSGGCFGDTKDDRRVNRTNVVEMIPTRIQNYD